MRYDPSAVNVWFVNVGHGDSTIVWFAHWGRVMMVDINNSNSLDRATRGEILESIGVADTRKLLIELGFERLTANEKAALDRYESLLEDPIDVLKRECPGQDVFRFVATHPHLDHLNGIYRLFRQESIEILNFWDTENMRTISKAEREKMSQEDILNWDEYQRIRKCAHDPKVLRLLRGAEGYYYTPDGIIVLSPTQAIVEEANEKDAYEGWNHLSQVLYISYGSSSLILPGDASIEAQKDMVNAFGDSLSAVVLKAPHHGRETGYCEDFVKRVNPDYTIVSVGKKPENDASNKYRKYTQKRVVSTRMQGTIGLRMYQDGSLELYNSKDQRLDLKEDLKKKAGRAYYGTTWRP